MRQPSMLPGPAVPGCCLVSFHFLCDIHSIHSVCSSTIILISRLSRCPSRVSTRHQPNRPTCIWHVRNGLTASSNCLQQTLYPRLRDVRWSGATQHSCVPVIAIHYPSPSLPSVFSGQVIGRTSSDPLPKQNSFGEDRMPHFADSS